MAWAALRTVVARSFQKVSTNQNPTMHSSWTSL